MDQQPQVVLDETTVRKFSRMNGDGIIRETREVTKTVSDGEGEVTQRWVDEKTDSFGLPMDEESRPFFCGCGRIALDNYFDCDYGFHRLCNIHRHNSPFAFFARSAASISSNNNSHDDQHSGVCQRCFWLAILPAAVLTLLGRSIAFPFLTVLRAIRSDASSDPYIPTGPSVPRIPQSVAKGELQ